MKLIDTAKSSWRWCVSHTGVVLTAIAASLALAGGAAAWLNVFGDGVVLWIAAAIFGASLVGRLVSARRAAKPDDTDEAGA